MKFRFAYLIIYLLLSDGVAGATTQTLAARLVALEREWAVISYQSSDQEQERQFKDLISRTQILKRDFPQRAEPYIWEAIATISLADVMNSLTALNLIRTARDLLIRALAIDGRALNGKAHIALGLLYHKAPRWPLSFGDDDKALGHYQEALKLDPLGLDINYYYGRFLYDRNDFPGAMQHFKSALQTPPPPQQTLAEEGRRQDIRRYIGKTERKLNRTVPRHADK